MPTIQISLSIIMFLHKKALDCFRKWMIRYVELMGGNNKYKKKTNLSASRVHKKVVTSSHCHFGRTDEPPLVYLWVEDLKTKINYYFIV